MTATYAQSTERQLTRSMIVTLLMVLVCALALLCGCSSEDDDEWTARSQEPSPYYDAHYFSSSNGRLSYRGSGSSSKTGVDVSDHQGDIDWDAVAADDIEFAFIRVGYRGTTEGHLYPDSTFAYNINAAQAAGLDCGVYFFSQAKTVEEAHEEAAFVLGLIAPYELQYPVVFDYEAHGDSRTANVDDETVTACARAFADDLQSAGYTVMLYGNYYDLERMNLGELSDLDIWFAEYDDRPSYTRRFTIWQYTSEGTVDGIGGGVDLNLDLVSSD